MLSLLVCPKVITLSGFYCTNTLSSPSIQCRVFIPIGISQTVIQIFLKNVNFWTKYLEALSHHTYELRLRLAMTSHRKSNPSRRKWMVQKRPWSVSREPSHDFWTTNFLTFLTECRRRWAAGRACKWDAASLADSGSCRLAGDVTWLLGQACLFPQLNLHTIQWRNNLRPD